MRGQIAEVNTMAALAGAGCLRNRQGVGATLISAGDFGRDIN